jgi:rod shape determining protein RodA
MRSAWMPDWLSAVLYKRASLRALITRRLKALFSVLDLQLTLCILLFTAGMLTMYSAGADFPGRFALHLRNVLIALGIMWAVAGVLLLPAVFMLGEVKKDSRRWLHIGFDMQPSEMMKIAMPPMLAWFFHHSSTSAW